MLSDVENASCYVLSNSSYLKGITHGDLCECFANIKCCHCVTSGTILIRPKSAEEMPFQFLNLSLMLLLLNNIKGGETATSL